MNHSNRIRLEPEIPPRTARAAATRVRMVMTDIWHGVVWKPRDVEREIKRLKVSLAEAHAEYSQSKKAETELDQRLAQPDLSEEVRTDLVKRRQTQGQWSSRLHRHVGQIQVQLRKLCALRRRLIMIDEIKPWRRRPRAFQKGNLS